MAGVWIDGSNWIDTDSDTGATQRKTLKQRRTQQETHTNTCKVNLVSSLAGSSLSVVVLRVMQLISRSRVAADTDRDDIHRHHHDTKLHVPFIPLVLTLISIGAAAASLLCVFVSPSQSRSMDCEVLFSFPFCFSAMEISSPLATHFDDRHTQATRTREIGNITHNESNASHNSNRRTRMRMAAQLLRLCMRRRRILLVASMAGLGIGVEMN